MMQENLKNKGGIKRKGVASLFDDYEIKDLFRRYVQLLIVVEVLIFWSAGSISWASTRSR
jgi:hypothetical protein